MRIGVVSAGPAIAVAQEQTWKINLKNADIGEFVTQVAAITGKTFVVDPRVKGKVTVISSESLDRDGIYELFLAVLRVHGFAAIETGGRRAHSAADAREAKRQPARRRRRRSPASSSSRA